MKEAQEYFRQKLRRSTFRVGQKRIAGAEACRSAKTSMLHDVEAVAAQLETEAAESLDSGMPAEQLRTGLGRARIESVYERAT